MNRKPGKNNDVCSEYCLSCQDKEEELRAMILEVSGLSELFRVLSDETRTKILYLLAERELCVCDLAYLLEMSIPAVSHHLRLLKIMRLARSRKDGKQVFYSLDDDHVISLIKIAQEHFVEKG
ncbi:MAG: helix-turn-helix transcriptional regulator [Spirochaetales bacterium]|nr:helix-turn-helix transcriptional regulator [Spirochaetales bacterium]